MWYIPAHGIDTSGDLDMLYLALPKNEKKIEFIYDFYIFCNSFLDTSISTIWQLISFFVTTPFYWVSKGAPS